MLVSENGVVAFIGMTSDGAKEAGLSDRLYGLNAPSEPVHDKLAQRGINLSDCLVYVIEIVEREKRKMAKKEGVEYFEPIGNS